MRPATGALTFLLWLSSALAAGDPAKGKELFRSCSGCHHTDTDARKMGPSLRSLFGKVLLRNGKRANEENVRTIIQEGWNGMPSFMYTFRPAELDDLMAYLKTLNARVSVASDAATSDPVTAGRLFFDGYCLRCHTTGSRERVPGGDLRGLYRKETLLNGQPVSDANITGLLQDEHGGAPSMKTWLDAAALKNLLAYLKTH